jgi:hypothetical protein
MFASWPSGQQATGHQLAEQLQESASTWIGDRHPE